MEQYNIGTTNLSPLAILATLLCICIALFSRRDKAIVSLLIALSFIPASQRLTIAGVNFPIMRIVIVFVLLRALMRNEHRYLKINQLDQILFIYSLVAIVVFTMQYQTPSALITMLGNTVDNLGGYLAVRILIRDIKDVKTIIKVLAITSVSLVFFFYYESRNGISLLRSLFQDYSSVASREGRFRAEGAYVNYILAGAFWAACIPLFLGFFEEKGSKWNALVWLSIITAMGIIYFCASSTPIMSLVFGFAATALYYQRISINRMLVLSILTIAAISLMWGKPIWFLFAKIDVAGGSTGYFRYLLFDSFIRNWHEWIILGLTDTEHWGYGLRDVTNQYVLEGVRGGGLGLALFIASIVISFRYLGALVNKAEGEKSRIQYWQLGASLIVHLFNFLGVSYFGQVRFIWWMTIGIISSLYQKEFSMNKTAAEQLRSSEDRMVSGSVLST